MRNGQQLICDAVDGMFTMNLMDKFSSVDFSAVAVKKFSFLFAISKGANWYLWLRAVVSKSHGLQLFDLDHQMSPITLRQDFMLNTVAVFGMVPRASTGRTGINFAVYAENKGSGTRTGYFGNVEWPRSTADSEVN